MQVVRQKLHRDLPPSTIWAYNGQYPGPTFEARRGQPIAVRWMNNLPSRHMFPIDDALRGVDGEPDVRTVVHLHGHKVLPESDGYPEAWFTNGFARTGPFFEQRTYRYPNDQAATQLWYHDHALGATRLNNYAGLSGVYLLRDRVEDGLNLPSGPFEIPLVIQDRLFNPDGSLLYPVVDKGGDPDPRVPPIGSLSSSAFLEVEPRKYRFRILNASNARFYHLTLNEAGGPRNGSTAARARASSRSARTAACCRRRSVRTSSRSGSHWRECRSSTRAPPSRRATWCSPSSTRPSPSKTRSSRSSTPRGRIR
jgi:spore coat protein A